MENKMMDDKSWNHDVGVVTLDVVMFSDELRISCQSQLMLLHLL